MPLARRLPKFGFHSPHRTEYQVLNVETLEACVSNGRLPKDQRITPETLWEAGLINRQGMPVKILGNGELTKKLAVTAHRFSASAREKIEAAGGSVVALREPSETKSRKRRKLMAAKRASGTLPASSETEGEAEVPERQEAEASEDQED